MKYNYRLILNFILQVWKCTWIYYHSKSYYLRCWKLGFLLISFVMFVSVSAYKSSFLPSHHTTASISIPTVVKPGTWMFMVMVLLCLTLLFIYLFIYFWVKIWRYKLQFLHSMVQYHYVLIVMLVSCLLRLQDALLSQKCYIEFLCIFFYDLKLQNEEHKVRLQFKVISLRILPFPCKKECAVASWSLQCGSCGKKMQCLHSLKCFSLLRPARPTN